MQRRFTTAIIKKTIRPGVIRYQTDITYVAVYGIIRVRVCSIE
jgi:hypothetical protein